MPIEIIQPLSIGEDGEQVIHLAATESNDDWMRANRLLENGEEEAFKEMDDTEMVIFTPEPEESL